MKSAIQYRPDIDGLRAIAVLLVVGYHGFSHKMAGGFIGVDIFFVISGFLIASIIYTEMIDGRFSIAAFYGRRIRRLFPALLIVTFASFVIGWNLLPPKEFASLGTNIAGGSVFIQNLVLLYQTGYFDIDASKKPLLHLWSLGIEEQYYIFWPLILLLIIKLRRSVIWVTSILAGISFAACVLTLSNHYAQPAFYLPVTRWWELLLGALLAFGMLSSRREYNKVGGSNPSRAMTDKWHHVAATIALILIAYSLATFNPKSNYPGVNALIPVVAAMLLLMSSTSYVNRYLLSSRWMVAIGLVSYPLYLWHFPLMAYARILYPDAVTHVKMLFIILMSLMLSIMTYHYIEKPLRHGQKKLIKNLGLLTAMCVMGFLGIVTVTTGGFINRVPSQIRGFMLTGDETRANWRRGTCLMLPEQNASHFTPDCAGKKIHPYVFVWGDSYAAALYAGLNHMRVNNSYGLAEYTASACPPLLGYEQPERRYCKSINDYVVRQIKLLHPDVVVLHSTWSYAEMDLVTGLQKTIEALHKDGIKRIVLVGPVPTWLGLGLSENVLDYYYKGSMHQLIPSRTFYRSNHNWDTGLDHLLNKIAQLNNVNYISPLGVLCDEKGCLARIGSNGANLSAFDNGHLTLMGSVYLNERIKKQLFG